MSKKKLRVAITTWWDENCMTYAETSDELKRLYCENQGFTFMPSHERRHPELHPSWEKPDLLLSLFDQFDYIVWMDADTLIVNPKFDVRTIFDDSPIYISKDINGFNSGVYAVKSCEKARQILQDTMALAPKYKDHPWWDQAAMMELLADKYKNDVKIIPARSWNSYPPEFFDVSMPNLYEDGDFLVHLPGVPRQIRNSYFNYMFRTHVDRFIPPIPFRIRRKLRKILAKLRQK